ncbi:MAG TPA: hypothetical protein PLK67_10110 [Bryobacteraceae bacterium]|nr:hypothetical protein [Bryobacteraceae bacterium]
MKTITITISDEHAEAIEAFLRPQLRQVHDEATGMVTTEPVYSGGVAEFLTEQLGQLIQGIVRQRPSAAVREKLLAIKALEKELAELTKPVVTVTEVK